MPARFLHIVLALVFCCNVFYGGVASLQMFASFCSIYVARLANLPSGLYVSFFFIFYDFLETSYLRIYWTDFHIFLTK